MSPDCTNGNESKPFDFKSYFLDSSMEDQSRNAMWTTLNHPPLVLQPPHSSLSFASLVQSLTNPLSASLATSSTPESLMSMMPTHHLYDASMRTVSKSSGEFSDESLQRVEVLNSNHPLKHSDHSMLIEQGFSCYSSTEPFDSFSLSSSSFTTSCNPLTSASFGSTYPSTDFALASTPTTLHNTSPPNSIFDRFRNFPKSRQKEIPKFAQSPIHRTPAIRSLQRSALLSSTGAVEPIRPLYPESLTHYTKLPSNVSMPQGIVHPPSAFATPTPSAPPTPAPRFPVLSQKQAKVQEIIEELIQLQNGKAKIEKDWTIHRARKEGERCSVWTEARHKEHDEAIERSRKRRVAGLRSIERKEAKVLKRLQELQGQPLLANQVPSKPKRGPVHPTKPKRVNSSKPNRGNGVEMLGFIRLRLGQGPLDDRQRFDQPVPRRPVPPPLPSTKNVVAPTQKAAASSSLQVAFSPSLSRFIQIASQGYGPLRSSSALVSNAQSNQRFGSQVTW